MRAMAMLALAAALLANAGCMKLRVTTTPRTAVEQALLSQAAEKTISQFEFGKLRGKSFAIDAADFDAIDSKYILGTLKQRLLEAGLKEAKAEEAGLLIYPRVANAGIDDSRFLIGVPEIPLGIAGMGSIEIPEASLLGWSTQRACNRMAVYAVDAKTGQLALAAKTVSSETHFRVITILFIFSFKATDLSEPF